MPLPVSKTTTCQTVLTAGSGCYSRFSLLRRAHRVARPTYDVRCSFRGRHGHNHATVPQPSPSLFADCMRASGHVSREGMTPYLAGRKYRGLRRVGQAVRSGQSSPPTKPSPAAGPPILTRRESDPGQAVLLVCLPPARSVRQRQGSTPNATGGDREKQIIRLPCPWGEALPAPIRLDDT